MAKGLFVCRRARPDIHLVVAVLTTRVQNPNKGDWKELIDLLKYRNGTREDKLIIQWKIYI